MRRLESLTRADDFQRLFRGGVSARIPGVTISAAPGQTEAPRLGLAVRAPRAVDRNLAKRRLRAACREALREPAHPVDIAVRADVRSSSVSFQELVDTFQKAVAS